VPKQSPRGAVRRLVAVTLAGLRPPALTHSDAPGAGPSAKVVARRFSRPVRLPVEYCTPRTSLTDKCLEKDKDT
jgi:hypothetical protein